jgi:hypothetical protein
MNTAMVLCILGERNWISPLDGVSEVCGLAKTLD